MDERPVMQDVKKTSSQIMGQFPGHKTGQMAGEATKEAVAFAQRVQADSREPA
jgi:hypothetical protein